MEIALRDDFSCFWPVGKIFEPKHRPAKNENFTQAAEASWIREVLRARRRRDAYFSARLFGDPAWDMILELYRAGLAQQKLSVSSLCLASGAPATTALRWITALQRDGLIDRHSDPLDGRRVFVMLTDEGRRAMRDYLSSLPQSIYPFSS